MRCREQRMCLGTFSRLRRSLATSTLYAAVRILAERFLLYRKAISCKAKNKPHTSLFPVICGVTIFYVLNDIHSTKIQTSSATRFHQVSGWTFALSSRFAYGSHSLSAQCLHHSHSGWGSCWHCWCFFFDVCYD